MASPTQAQEQAELAALDALFVALGQDRAKTYSNTAALVVLVYDTLLNMDHEIEQIWMAAWSVPKVLYILARYYSIVHVSLMVALGIATNLSDAACTAWSWLYQLGGPVIFTSLVNVILLLRIRAIYDGSKIVTWVLAFLMTCQFALELTVTIWSIVIIQRVQVPSFVPWPGCLAESLGHQTLLAWVPCIFVAFVCAVLTVYRFLTVFGVTWGRRASIQVSPLFRQFVLDGTLGFVLIFATNLTTTIVTNKVDNPYADVTTQWLIVVYALAGAKMILNLRVTARAAAGGDLSSMFTAQSEPRFAHALHADKDARHGHDALEMMTFAEPSFDWTTSSESRGYGEQC